MTMSPGERSHRSKSLRLGGVWFEMTAMRDSPTHEPYDDTSPLLSGRARDPIYESIRHVKATTAETLMASD